MMDAMEIARKQRQDHIDDIARMEAEIEALRERIGELDIFLDFGETLLKGDTNENARPTSAPAPMPRVFSRTPEIKSVQADDDWDDDQDDENRDEIDDEEEDDPIARVIAAHGG